MLLQFVYGTSGRMTLTPVDIIIKPKTVQWNRVIKMLKSQRFHILTVFLVLSWVSELR
jgi:hypothetical protein